jgi:eukaryotic-like serine/threonine-protein kinase
MPGEDEDAVVRANARIGMLLKGKYTLDRVLGIGGMATVYAATHRNGKEFAVKVLHADLSLRTDTRTRFLREGYLANRVNHPGSVAVLDDDIAEDGAAFLVMELLRGQTLETLWEGNQCRLPLALVAGVGLQLLDVLAAAHARGLTHRDIKPANLLVTHDGLVKVLDFGIARLRDVAAGRTTQTGMVMGTPAFMAPEQALAKAEEIDAQTDLWAAGATLFTLATGQLVHEGANAQQILVRAATAAARPCALVMPSAPAALCGVIDRALAFEKSKRWSTAVAMREALNVASREAFAAFPTPPALAGILDELGEHEKTAVQPSTDLPHVLTLVSSGRDPDPLQRKPAVGPITAEAVASDPAVERSMAKPRGGLTAAAIVIVALGIGGLLLAAIRGGPSKDSTTFGTATGASRPAVAPGPSAAPSPASPVSSSTWTPVVPAAPAEPVAPNVPSRAEPIVPAVATRPALPAPTVAPARAPILAPPPAATAAPVAKPSCEPPYEFDDKGNKRWKRECL